MADNLPVHVLQHRCKKRFLFRARFYVFNVFFIFPFFIFKNIHWKYHLKSLSKQRKQIGSVWLFFFVPMLEFPYQPIYWQASLFTYRTGLHQVTPLGVVFLLVNWWVEKHQHFLFNVYKCFFFIFVTFVTFFIFLECFLHVLQYQSLPPSSLAPVKIQNGDILVLANPAEPGKLYNCCTTK